MVASELGAAGRRPSLLGHAAALPNPAPVAPARSAPVSSMSGELHYDLTLYPAPVLRRRAEPFEAFDDELRAIAEAMFERMYASQGVGLAGPQVGLKKRILVLNATGEKADERCLVNPTILDRSGPKTSFEEGCLSFPGIYASVERPENCSVRSYTLEGELIEETFSGFPSRIVQHEYDHLEGVLLVDRMSQADKLRHKAALDELVDKYKRARAAEPSRR